MKRIMLWLAAGTAVTLAGCYNHPFQRGYYCAPPAYPQPVYAAPPVAAPVPATTYAPTTCIPAQMPQCTCY